MTKRAQEESSDRAEQIVAENAEHEGTPRTTSAARAQESWEEFKERSNRAAESVIDDVTSPEAREASLRARGFFRSYRAYFIAAAVVITAGALYAALKPPPKRSWFRL